MTLELRDLHKRYGGRPEPVLDGVSLTVDEGSLTCLLGPSGAGKSTLLHIVAGLTAADGGEVILDGVPLAAVAAHHRPLTMLMQRPHLFEHLSVLDNVAFGLRVRHHRRARRRSEAMAYLRLVGLEDLAGRAPRQLSGGEAQRVALARALAIEPAVLLADEPFSGVDTPVRRELQDLVSGLHRTLGTTMVLVTHDRDEALAMADRLAVLDEGRIQDHGEPRAIYERPTSERAARLLGFTNRWPAAVCDGRLLLAGRRLEVCAANALGPLAPLGPARHAVWAIRPEHVRLATAPAANTVAGEVIDQRYLGPVVEVTIAVQDVLVVAHLPADRHPRLGEVLSVELAARHLIELRP